ncbi:MAG: MBL fold metallo-hydrolase [Ktedonobacteraceae bacterium]|nr:MBL fold metallo-hydrolase [Ktedonobacteraceae bacterium]MBO0791971.1 MBL fold metallo-hydrolase [Ktedonobacteraceae bacterium]
MAGKQRFLVRFWGVRGSYPTPGPHTLRHGGNTSCVEIQVGSHTLILDAGSGIIQLGQDLMQQAVQQDTLDLALFITHGHGDHLVGFPFFAPLFDARTNLHLFGPELAGHNIEQLVTSLMSPPYFPVDVRTLPSHRTYHTLTGTQCICWQPDNKNPFIKQQVSSPNNPNEVRITTCMTQTHPLDGALIYCIEYAGRRLVYATDVEWSNGQEADFLALSQGADLLIHDAQYTQHDYEHIKHGFGHSTVEMATEAARAAHVHELILFHHEPTYDDDQLDRMEEAARKRFAHTRSAYEGLEIDLLQKK